MNRRIRGNNASMKRMAFCPLYHRIRLSIPRKCSIIGINSCTMQLSVCKEVFGKDGRVCERESVIND